MHRTTICILCIVLMHFAVNVNLSAAAAAAVLQQQQQQQQHGSEMDSSNRCKWMMNSRNGIVRFSAMPGSGWDNLRNKGMGEVAELSFTDCILSPDGQFVLPQSVVLHPRKQSQVSINAQVFEHYNNYTDSTTFSMSAGGHGMLHSFGLGGKFSYEYQKVKSTAVASKTQIARVQLKYDRYTVQLQPDFKLAPAFEKRINDIASYLVNGNNQSARYLSDLLVRDFGTHYISSVDAGGILEKTDFFDESSLTTFKSWRSKASAAISVSFLKVFGMNADSSVTVTQQELDVYKRSVRDSAVTAHGGPLLGSSMNLSHWEGKLNENLVPIDREGQPLFNLITKRALPDVPLPIMDKLVAAVRDAVMRYYHANMIKGCQDPNSPNFDPTANIGGSCEPPLTNFSFGGVYQTCRDNNPAAGLSLCSEDKGLSQRNPITGEFSCPSGYEPVKLLEQAGPPGKRCWEKKKRCWGFFTCKDGSECVQSTSTLTAYWCPVRATANVPQASGMVYGGMYSKRQVNPLTDERSCPAYFRPFRLGTDMNFCLSRDFSMAAKSRIPLGGFFSCRSGNPLAEAGRNIVASWQLKATGAHSANSFNNFPQKCPEGFSQMTVDIIDGCSLMVCEKFKRDLGVQFAVRPPFENPSFANFGRPVVQVTDGIRQWDLNLTTELWQFSGFRKQMLDSALDTNSSTSASGAAITLTIAIVVAVAVVAALALVAVKALRSRRRRAEGFRPLPAEAAAAVAGYGAVNDGYNEAVPHHGVAGEDREDDDEEVVAVAVRS